MRSPCAVSKSWYNTGVEGQPMTYSVTWYHTEKKPIHTRLSEAVEFMELSFPLKISEVKRQYKI